MVRRRCNCDFKFAVRGYPCASNEDDTAVPRFKCSDSLLPVLLDVPRKLLENQITNQVQHCAW